MDRSSHLQMFFAKDVLILGVKFTEYSSRSAISIKMQSNFFEIALRHGCSLTNLLHAFRTPYSKNTFGWFLLNGKILNCQ